MHSTMSSKLKGFLFWAIGIAFWLIIWEISAILINERFLFPTIGDVISSLVSNAFSENRSTLFWSSIFFSLLRVLIGLVCGVLFALSLAIATHFIPFLECFIKPIVTLLRSTPVASFIMILCFLILDFYVPSVISCIIVFPIVWDSAHMSLSNPNKELSEVALVFGFSKKKKFTLVTLPQMIKSVIPAIITSAGLAWKSGIAAEIITYTEASIGKLISDSKNQVEGAELFAWTLVVVLLSLVVEVSIKTALKKVKTLWV